jgi:NDP-sugar pyrophosphorylase family protein
MSVTDGFRRGEKKYELVPDQQIMVAGTTLYRIRALKDFGNVKAGDLGGFIRSEDNLSQRGDCWIDDEAQVYDGAVISDDAQVFGRGRVYGHARVSDKGQVLGNAEVFGNGRVFKNGVVFDNARVFGAAQVRDNGLAYGDAEIFDDVRVVDRGQVCGDARIGGRTVVDGREKVDGVVSHAPQRRPTGRGRPRTPRGPRP